MSTKITPTNIDILFENENFLALYKPAGLVVHPDGKTIEPTLCDWLLEHYPTMKEVGEPMILQNGTVIYRPGIVHRLDRETSGVMIVAKTQEAFLHFKQQFKDREVKKIYGAFVWGLVKEDKGVIDRPIGRSKNDFRKWSAERFARGELRPAVTEYKVLNRLEEEIHKPSEIPMNFSYIEAFPKTGRTHQIRVHFKAINHPVVGDTLYAPNHPVGKKALGFNRVALHAKSIEIEDIDGETYTIEAALPEDFVAALKTLSKTVEKLA